MTRSQLKQICISILVGASVAFVTTLLEGILGYLRAHVIDVTGVGTGVVWYLKSWKTTLTA